MATYVNLDTIYRASGLSSIPPVAYGDQINDNFSFLQAPPTARVNTSAAVTPASGTLSPIIFNSANYDPWTCWNAASKLVCPAYGAGVFIITGQTWWATSTAGTNRIAALYVNGTYIIGEDLRTAPGAGGYCNQSVSGQWKMASGDYVELWVQQDTGAGLNLTAALAFTRIANG